MICDNVEHQPQLLSHFHSFRYCWSLQCLLRGHSNQSARNHRQSHQPGMCIYSTKPPLTLRLDAANARVLKKFRKIVVRCLNVHDDDLNFHWILCSHSWYHTDKIQNHNALMLTHLADQLFMQRRTKVQRLSTTHFFSFHPFYPRPLPSPAPFLCHRRTSPQPSPKPPLLPSQPVVHCLATPHP